MKEAVRKYGKSKDLGSVVRFSFLKTALIPILTIQLVLLFLYFLSINYITDKNLTLLRSNALKTLSEITKTEARSFDNQLREINRNNLSLQTEHEAIFGKAATHSFSYDKKFFFEETGYGLNQNLNPMGRSSLFLSSNAKLNSRLRRKIIKTKDMGGRFRSLVDNNPNLVAASFKSWDGMIRAYPLMNDFNDRFPTDFDLTQYSNYYHADKKHNPERGSVWTDVHLDPAGKGWMLSNIVPIYQNNFLEGVTELDVTLGSFTQEILSAHLQWNSGALVMDRHGNILTMTRAAEGFLGIGDVKDYNYKDNPVDRTLTKPTKFNLLRQNTSAGMYFSEFFNSNRKSLEFSMKGVEYLVTKNEISETGWHLFVIAPLSNIYGPILQEKEKLNQLGLTFVSLALIFYALYFVHLNKSSRSLARRITSPIAQVTQMISTRESDDKTHETHNPVNITELDNLLSMNLKIQSSKLRYQRVSQEMELKNVQLRTLAITDPLTQLYNRLKLDEVLAYEIARSRRDETPLTVAIIDVDKFKLVNDIFGHHVGDTVLIGVSQIMLKNTRSTDFLGRWGGEEFLLVLPNTPLNSAFEYVDQLRQKIEQASFSPVAQVTISIGLACSANIVCEKTLIDLADKALYEAKQNGRNRVELAAEAPTRKSLAKVAS